MKFTHECTDADILAAFTASREAYGLVDTDQDYFEHLVVEMFKDIARNYAPTVKAAEAALASAKQAVAEKYAPATDQALAQDEVQP